MGRPRLLFGTLFSQVWVPHNLPDRDIGSSDRPVPDWVLGTPDSGGSDSSKIVSGIYRLVSSFFPVSSTLYLFKKPLSDTVSKVGDQLLCFIFFTCAFSTLFFSLINSYTTRDITVFILNGPSYFGASLLVTKSGPDDNV